MKKAIVLLAVLALILATAAPSDAWRGHHGHWRGGCCWGWWWPGAIIGGLALGAAVAATAPFVYAPPVYAAPPPVVYREPAPIVYQQAPAPAPPLVQREVVYPHGRYVLHGDGVSQPWQWVWVPSGTR
jgi:hypothetical protein